MKTAFRGRSFLGTFAVTLLAIAGLFVADVFLAKVDRSESQTEATRLFKEGQTLLGEGQGPTAIERINDALVIERGNREYMSTLAQAELAAGRSSDAEATLTQLLANDSTDGFTNLLMGRVLAREKRFEEATSYFERAIYGHWRGDVEGQRSRARLELSDLLGQRDAKGKQQ
jgi:Flp pilus assembly protein TadD